MKDFALIINGQRVAGASTMDVINPATGELVAHCPRADEAQLNQAVAAAREAFPSWSAIDISERRQKLVEIAQALEARTDEFSELLTAEQGKPAAEAQGEVMGTGMMAQVLASFDLPESVIHEDESGQYLEHRTPLGVVAAITPWNFPLSQIVIKAIPALLAGNTVVAKPAPTTPLTSLLFAEICNDILPAGALNIIVDQNDLGALLTTHPDVAKVSFTGSTMTGKKVMGSAADTLKRVTLELGGNDAAIVLDDMDPKSAAEKLFTGSMMNCGQICLAIKRAYVPASIYDEVCDELARLADAAVVGDGRDPGVQVGPMQNRAQYNKVLELIESAREEGSIIAGGKALEGPGLFIRPTIVRDITDDARLVREEQFGPVLPVISYASVNDAIASANDTDYGLGGTVWAGDAQRATEVAKKMVTGIVWINSHMMIHPTVTTGGAKHSGIGTELGLEGLKHFTQRHVIFVPK